MTPAAPVPDADDVAAARAWLAEHVIGGDDWEDEQVASLAAWRAAARRDGFAAGVEAMRADSINAICEGCRRGVPPVAPTRAYPLWHHDKWPWNCAAHPIRALKPEGLTLPADRGALIERSFEAPDNATTVPLTPEEPRA